MASKQKSRLLLWLAGCRLLAIVMYLLVLPRTTELPARKLEDCPPPPDGFVTGYCGHDLMAVVLQSEDRHEVRVLQAHPETLVLVDTSHTWLNLKTQQSYLAYANSLNELVKKYATQHSEAPTTILLLGIGGAALPFMLAKQCDTCKLTAVDLSKDAIKIARNLVQPDDGNKTTYVQDDAGHFLKHAGAAKYDIVITDAYNGDKIAPSLLTPATTEYVYKALKTGGLYLTNVYVNKEDSILPEFEMLVGAVFGQEHTSSDVVVDGHNWQSVIFTGSKVAKSS